MPDRNHCPPILLLTTLVHPAIAVTLQLFLTRTCSIAAMNEHTRMAGQPIRASGYEPEGREFESLRARHFS